MDIRPSFDIMFLKTCNLWKERSTCQRLQTAAIIVKDNNIISIGYNGVPTNQKHCIDFWKEFYIIIKGLSGISPNNELLKFHNSIIKDLNFNDNILLPFTTYEEFIKSDEFRILHHYWSDMNELHAEQNALLQSEISTNGATLYTLYSPCRQCAKSIISAKIKKVIYNYDYSRDLEGIEMLKHSGIDIKKF
jgi:dCMP deaminase